MIIYKWLLFETPKFYKKGNTAILNFKGSFNYASTAILLCSTSYSLVISKFTDQYQGFKWHKIDIEFKQYANW